jgi:DNA-binding SARP family transcriptional activator
MGVNLESRQSRRLQQRQPLSSWSRSPDRSGADHPVHIHTLGRFSVQLHHQSLVHNRSRQQRPFELLQALIAFGGRDIHAEVLSQALWPDTEGDNAQNAFDVTLHRLRHLFGIEDLFMVHDRRLTLNSSLAWVDAWAFERLVNHSERLLKRAEDPMTGRQIAHCSERLLNLYQGGFLERESTCPWMLTLRERLRSKLLRHLLDTGQAWENAGEWDKAIRFYQKALEIEPFSEQLYQRLMISYRETQCIADALATFRRCQRVLANQFQIPPSQLTHRIYLSLRS